MTKKSVFRETTCPEMTLQLDHSQSLFRYPTGCEVFDTLKHGEEKSLSNVLFAVL